MSDGYTRLYLTDGRLVSEHRHVMEQHLGRKLRTGEIVHHRDGDKSNNDIANLEVVSKSQHMQEHFSGREMVALICPVCGSTFEREASKVRSGQRRGQRLFLCSRSCIGKAVGRSRSL
jgi:YHS domain-containing protein